MTAPRESSWADVDVALEQARRRLHPRWWAGLPEAALLLVALTAILSSVAWGWLILVCISILIIFGRMRPALVGAEHRYPAYGPASVSLLVSKSLALIWIIWAIWSVPEGRPLGISFALALLTVTVVGILELLTQGCWPPRCPMPVGGGLPWPDDPNCIRHFVTRLSCGPW